MSFILLENITDWMSFNLFLALVPLVLSFPLFTKNSWCVDTTKEALINSFKVHSYPSVQEAKKGTFHILLSLKNGLNQCFPKQVIWWGMFLCYVIFLPNAPYVITDIVHLVRQIKDYNYFKLTDLQIMTLLIPEYMIFIFAGFSCYVIAFQRFLKFIKRRGVNKPLYLVAKYLSPLVSVIGVYLGRCHRFTSWDIFHEFYHIVEILLDEFYNLKFYGYILYVYVLVLMFFEIFSLFYKLIFKELFSED